MGVGLMGLSAFYKDTDQSDEARFEVLDAAHAAGQVLWDSADVYGDKCDSLTLRWSWASLSLPMDLWAAALAPIRSLHQAAFRLATSA